MKKSLIALAVLGVVASAAHAQSSVTVYGMVDLGYSKTNRSSDTVTMTPRETNRLGFKGGEDIGGGLKAIFQLEERFNANNGATRDTARMFNGPANVGISGDFGTIRFGRVDSPANEAHRKFDPFNQYGFAYGYVNSKGGASQRLSIENDRQDNTVRYDSPNFNGFSVAMNYSLKAETATGTNVGYGVTAKYANGPLSLAAGYDKPNDTAGSNSTSTALSSAMKDSHFWFIGGAYQFGPVKLSASYLKGSDKKDSFVNMNVEQTVIGLNYTVGAGDIRLAYDTMTANDHKDKKVELGYWHHLSKRTDLWASIAYITGDNVDTDYLAGSSVSGAFDRSSGVALGMTHRF